MKPIVICILAISCLAIVFVLVRKDAEAPSSGATAPSSGATAPQGSISLPPNTPSGTWLASAKNISVSGNTLTADLLTGLNLPSGMPEYRRDSVKFKKGDLFENRFGSFQKFNERGPNVSCYEIGTAPFCDGPDDMKDISGFSDCGPNIPQIQCDRTFPYKPYLVYDEKREFESLNDPTIGQTFGVCFMVNNKVNKSECWTGSKSKICCQNPGDYSGSQQMMDSVAKRWGWKKL